MNITKQKQEALWRMKEWDLFFPVIKDFDMNNNIMESAPPLGACYYLEEPYLQKIRAVEQEFDVLVYHVIHSYTEFGELLNLLFVSKYDEEWEMDEENIKKGLHLCYVINLTHPEWSEMGTISIKKTVGGGLERVR
ncbi:MAG: hypothetical protein K6F34_11435 [Lachnospiraceae bacterium]|nr:hypothetical protein [Lachnospiraceae bacterium]